MTNFEHNDCAKRGLIQIAARLALCNALDELEEVCENQRTIKTSKLQGIVERASNTLKNEAVYIRTMSDKLRIELAGKEEVIKELEKDIKYYR